MSHTNRRSIQNMIGVVMNFLVGMGLKGRQTMCICLLVLNVISTQLKVYFYGYSFHLELFRGYFSPSRLTAIGGCLILSQDRRQLDEGAVSPKLGVEKVKTYCAHLTTAFTGHFCFHSWCPALVALRHAIGYEFGHQGAGLWG